MHGDKKTRKPSYKVDEIELQNVTKYEVRALMVMMMENRHMTEFPTRVIIPFGLLL